MRLADRERLVREVFGDLADSVTRQNYKGRNYFVVTSGSLACAVSFSGARRTEHFLDRARNFKSILENGLALAR